MTALAVSRRATPRRAPSKCSRPATNLVHSPHGSVPIAIASITSSMTPTASQSRSQGGRGAVCQCVTPLLPFGRPTSLGQTGCLQNISCGVRRKIGRFHHLRQTVSDPIELVRTIDAGDEKVTPGLQTCCMIHSASDLQKLVCCPVHHEDAC